MRIIISPAKKMKTDNDFLSHRHMPVFIKETQELLEYLSNRTYEELKEIWKCNENIANENYDRIKNMDLYKNLTPAILSYEGIQYQYMAPSVFQYNELEYINEHLRIISGFYGILKPFDGVVPYRLEMQSNLPDWKVKGLYEFWDKKIADNLVKETNIIINLASKEYSKSIEKYLPKDVRFITCIFGELVNGKVIEKGTFAKMARGEMVRFMAENKIMDLESIKIFNRLGYEFNIDLSNDKKYVFIKLESKGE